MLQSKNREEAGTQLIFTSVAIASKIAHSVHVQSAWMMSHPRGSCGMCGAETRQHSQIGQPLRCLDQYFPFQLEAVELLRGVVLACIV